MATNNGGTTSHIRIQNPVDCVSVLKIEWLGASVSTVTKHAPITTVSNSPAFSTRTDAFGICPQSTNQRRACPDWGVQGRKGKDRFRVSGGEGRIRSGGGVLVLMVVGSSGGGSGSSGGGSSSNSSGYSGGWWVVVANNDITTTTSTHHTTLRTTHTVTVLQWLCVQKRA
ncbi:hypothetical protein M0802_005734 [Mischocyttarus mexicanus]|nr:hypothetical protein M0802_005734 [Mischocyttarus mexicanus]